MVNINANANTNASTNVTVNNANVGPGGKVDISVAAINVGHTAATATTNVTGNNLITATGVVQILGPPPLLPMNEGTNTIRVT